MLKQSRAITEAKCDKCVKDLLSKHFDHQANYALLQARFGYGSPLDDDGPTYHLCEECWESALKFLGLPLSSHGMDPETPEEFLS